MKWLHMSDIHFNYNGYDSSNLKKKLLAKLSALNVTLDFILITGDCFYRNQASTSQINETADFIKSIAKNCKCPVKKIYICQGNHDVNRSDNARNELIDKIRNGEEQFAQLYDKLKELGGERFQMLHKAVTSRDYNSYRVYEPQNAQYRIISLNTTLLSKDDKDCGQLQLCNEKLLQLNSKIADDERINILIMHHDVKSLVSEDARKFEHWMDDNNVDIVFSGHTHRAAVEIFDDTFREIKQFTAGAIVVDDYAVPSFYLCDYDEISDVSIQLFTYATKKEEWVVDNSSLRKFKDGMHNYSLQRKESKKKNQLYN